MHLLICGKKTPLMRETAKLRLPLASTCHGQFVYQLRIAELHRGRKEVPEH